MVVGVRKYYSSDGRGLKMKKRSKNKVFIRISALILVLSVILVSISLYTEKDHLKDGKIVQHIFTKKVEQHRSVVHKYAKEYEVEQHVDVLLAMMMQESGGRGLDPMQSSESLCGSIGCIEDIEESIEQGVAYFAKNLEAANGDVELAIQAYNFGTGFVHYVHEQGATFHQDIVIQYSQEMYDQAKDKSIYTCLREEAKEYDACYGDIYYARDVMHYKNKFATHEG